MTDQPNDGAEDATHVLRRSSRGRVPRQRAVKGGRALPTQDAPVPVDEAGDPDLHLQWHLPGERRQVGGDGEQLRGIRRRRGSERQNSKRSSAIDHDPDNGDRCVGHHGSSRSLATAQDCQS